MVLKADNQQYGLVVDDILDTEEIVVKPLGHQLRHLPLYAGATIMGDGAVALILDATALARRAGMTPESELGGSTAATERATTTSPRCSWSSWVTVAERRSRWLRSTGSRRSSGAAWKRAGHHEVVQYRGQILPLVRLDHVLHGDGGHHGLEDLQVVVCRRGEQRAGVVVSEILDIVETALDTRTPLDSTGGDGSAVVSAT